MNVLAHYINEKDYLSIINGLHSNAEITLSVVDLHNQIFDFAYLHKPKNIILPIHDYTQEFHDFVSKNINNTNIFLYFGTAFNKELFEYCNAHGINTIGNQAYANYSIKYNQLYDSTVFVNQHKERNNKFLCILSADNKINQKFLDNKLYPNNNQQVCLINNPEYKHYQNIGIAYHSDLNIMLNTYASLIDLSKAFELEAQACNIPNLEYDESDDLLTTIEKQNIKSMHPDFDTFKSEYFISNSLMAKLRS